MKIVHEVPKRSYVNVMELLVAEEVAKQIESMPPRLLKYLKQVEVETYALNRLPSLYASSEKGWQHQYEKAKRELHSQIKSAVRQAFAAVQVDPIRTSKPLTLKDDESAQAALDNLREMLRQPELDWNGVVDRLRLLLKRPEGKAAPQPTPTAPTEGSHRTRSRSGPSGNTANYTDEDNHSHYWRPGTYGGEVSSWRDRQVKGKPKVPDSSEYDWNDPRYFK